MLKIALVVMMTILGMAISQAAALDALDRVIVSSKLVNASGEQIRERVNTNQRVYIASDIINGQNAEQPFIYILQIKDDIKDVVFISTFSGELHPVQTFNTALSWRPELPGTYTAEVFVWESLSNADALADPIFIDIIVS